MATEYSLYFKSKRNCSSSEIENIVGEGVSFFDVNDQVQQLDVFDLKGFFLFIHRKARNIAIGKESYEFNCFLGFRVNREFDPIEYKKNILDVIKGIIFFYDVEDLLFLFNGESIALLKDKSNLYIDNSWGFWDHGIINELGSFSYKEKEFDVADVEFL